MKAQALWLWSGEEASRALQTRNLATILRVYRRLNGISQEQVAKLLGYDKTYISMIETGRRVITDVGALRGIANRLNIPVHTLGVAEADDATFTAMVQFAESILSLADTARRSGHAVEAINELWPLVARLEARAADGLIERESLRLLARARLSLGVALGAALPEERLSTAARWTGRALIAAEWLGDADLIVGALTMHGNELRKAGRIGAALRRTITAVNLVKNADGRISALAILARAAGEAGNPQLFDSALKSYGSELDRDDNHGMLGNPFTFREIQLRGLVATNRAERAILLLDGDPNPLHPAVAPQWNVIERITVGEVLLANGERDVAESILVQALTVAERYRLPHQVQRVIRTSTRYHLHDPALVGRDALARLDKFISLPIGQ